jgi:hypothetical protein
VTQFPEHFYQRTSLGSQAGAGFFAGVNDFDLQMLFGGLNLAPDGFLRHFQGFGGLVDRTSRGDAFQNLHAALAENDIVVLIDKPMTGS